jgi:ribonuclease HI
MKKLTMFTYGSSHGNPGPAAIGAQLVFADGTVLQEVSEPIGNATNEYAEYFAVLRCLQTASEHFSQQTKDMAFELRLSNQLVKKQLNNESTITNPGLVPLFIEVHNLRVLNFPQLKLVLTEGKANQAVERLVNKVLDA